MRVSVDNNDPGFVNFRGYPTYVYLDGVEIGRNCVTADEDLGEVVVAKLNESGNPYVENDEVATEVRRGVVKIEHPPEMSA